MKNKELEVIEPRAPGTPESSMVSVVQYAIKEQVAPEQLEKLMALQERWEANEAKKAYHVAMTAFKKNPPTINKDAHVNYTHSKGTTDYKHATLANVTTTIGKALSKHGLSAGWKPEQIENKTKVTCTITHILGHSESCSLEAPPDTSGGKNSIQAIGSTVTYLERYTILALTGLATHESDDDGQGSEVEYITEDQMEKFNLAIESKQIDLSMFLDYMGVKALDKILVNDIKKAEHAIKSAKGKK